MTEYNHRLWRVNTKLCSNLYDWTIFNIHIEKEKERKVFADTVSADLA